MDADLKRRLLQRACDISGRERMCSRLGIEPHTLEFWLAGRATPPERVFLTAVDVVLDDDLARAGQDRRRNVVQRTVFGVWRDAGTSLAAKPEPTDRSPA
jgi:hypothetical protein